MSRYTIMHVRLWHIILYILTISICVFTLWSLESQTLPAWLKLMLDVMSGVSFGLSIVLIIGDAGKVSGIRMIVRALKNQPNARSRYFTHPT